MIIDERRLDIRNIFKNESKIFNNRLFNFSEDRESIIQDTSVGSLLIAKNFLVR